MMWARMTQVDPELVRVFRCINLQVVICMLVVVALRYSDCILGGSEFPCPPCSLCPIGLQWIVPGRDRLSLTGVDCAIRSSPVYVQLSMFDCVGFVGLGGLLCAACMWTPPGIE